MESDKSNDYVVRAIKVPIAEIIEGGTKQEFYTALRSSLKRCVAATNRCITECAVIDRDAYVAVGSGEKVPKRPKLYTYPVLKGQFNGMASVAASLARNAERHYAEYRWRILTGQRSLTTQRSCPMPLLCNKSRKMLVLSCDASGNLIARLPTLDGSLWTARIKGGSRYTRPLRTIKAAIEMDAVGDSKIWIDNRGVAMLGIACKIPKLRSTNINGVLKVATARDAFIVATKQQTDTPFTINADHVKRWQAERRRKQERLRQDRKSGQTRRHLIAVQDRVSRKFRQRLESFTHEAAAHIVQHAMRRKIAKIEYDGTIRSYFGSGFPYFEFAEKLKQKCEAVGIEFESVTSEIIGAGLDEPHIYFVAPIVSEGKIADRIKIGMTEQKNGKRKKSLEMAGGYELLVLATDKQPKSKLRQREKHYHAMFAKHLIDGQKEWFQREPVLDWLRETGCLGNAGNLSQITQYMEA